LGGPEPSRLHRGKNEESRWQTMWNLRQSRRTLKLVKPHCKNSHLIPHLLMAPLNKIQQTEGLGSAKAEGSGGGPHAPVTDETDSCLAGRLGRSRALGGRPKIGAGGVNPWSRALKYRAEPHTRKWFQGGRRHEPGESRGAYLRWIANDEDCPRTEKRTGWGSCMRMGNQKTLLQKKFTLTAQQSAHLTVLSKHRIKGVFLRS